MKMTGELLKAERLKQDLKISDIAFALKISARVIQHIEEGESDSLPAKTFVRGFVKSYAEYLKLDSSVVLKQFQEEMGSTSPVPKAPPPKTIHATEKFEQEKKDIVPPQINEPISTGLTKNHILVFVSVSLLITTLAFINHFINKYSKEKTTSIEPEQPLSRPDNSILVSSDPQSADLQVMSQTIPASADASTPVDIAPSDPDKKIPTEEAKIPPINYAPTGKSSGKPVEVLIEAKKDTTIEYSKGSANTFEKVVIKENSYQIIRSQTGLHLRSEDGSKFILTVNGIVQPTIKTKPFQISF